MVEDIINYVSSNWVAWVFAAGYAVLIAILKKERTQNKALREGVQALLRQEIIDFCLRYEDRGSAPVWAKQAEEKAYKAYEALGGNDVAHAMHERFMKLPPLDGNDTPERAED